MVSADGWRSQVQVGFGGGDGTWLGELGAGGLACRRGFGRALVLVVGLRSCESDQ